MAAKHIGRRTVSGKREAAVDNDEHRVLRIVASPTGLSVVRRAENYHLFFLGALSFIAASVARTVLR